jgi:Ala-tRNA(Pro) deacylase
MEGWAMAKFVDLINYLQRSNVPFEVIDHDLTFTAHQTAVASRVPDSELAKAVVVKVDRQYWMTVCRADARISEMALKQALCAKQVHLAHEEDLTSLFPDCQIGAMPPFGNLYGLPVIVDESLSNDEEIVFNACSHTKALKMKFTDFKKLVRPVITDFAQLPEMKERSNMGME